jgi:hypothetical protein
MRSPSTAPPWFLRDPWPSWTPDSSQHCLAQTNRTRTCESRILILVAQLYIINWLWRWAYTLNSDSLPRFPVRVQSHAGRSTDNIWGSRSCRVGFGYLCCAAISSRGSSLAIRSGHNALAALPRRYSLSPHSPLRLLGRVYWAIECHVTERLGTHVSHTTSLERVGRQRH